MKKNQKINYEEKIFKSQSKKREKNWYLMNRKNYFNSIKDIEEKLNNKNKYIFIIKKSLNLLDFLIY